MIEAEHLKRRYDDVLVSDETILESSLVGAGYCSEGDGSASTHKQIVNSGDSRAHQLALLLVGIWILNLFDLQLTVMAMHLGLLRECNPVAAWVMTYGESALVTYKVVLVVISTGFLWWSRYHSWALKAAWLMASAYVVLAVSWYVFYQEATSTLIRLSLAQEILPYLTIPLPW